MSDKATGVGCRQHRDQLYSGQKIDGVGSNMNRVMLTAAVSPTPELPFPVVYTPRGATDEMYLSSCDFATPGSPGDTVEQRTQEEANPATRLHRHREYCVRPHASEEDRRSDQRASPLHTNTNHDTSVLGRRHE